MDELRSDIIGVCGEGQITKEDYETVLMPLLAKQYAKGKPIRLLYQIGPAFSGFTAGAMWDDFRVGIKYMMHMEKCAIVTDVEWLRKSADFFKSFMPCAVQLFQNENLKNALDWLAVVVPESNLKFELGDDGVLVLHPTGALRREDFEKLSQAVDPWIKAHSSLKGVVIAIRKFPGWEDVGSFIQHLSFVGSHQNKVKRIAIAVDGELPILVSKLASYFIEAQIKHFPFAKELDALLWARS
jgi:hypothetical protein